MLQLLGVAPRQSDGLYYISSDCSSSEHSTSPHPNVNIASLMAKVRKIAEQSQDEDDECESLDATQGSEFISRNEVADLEDVVDVANAPVSNPDHCAETNVVATPKDAVQLWHRRLAHTVSASLVKRLKKDQIIPSSSASLVYLVSSRSHFADLPVLPHILVIFIQISLPQEQILMMDSSTTSLLWMNTPDSSAQGLFVSKVKLLKLFSSMSSGLNVIQELWFCPCTLMAVRSFSELRRG
ncbi:retrotransposon protein [Gracilaria domingensis]|nr:retrotransposon protein [Gracilaria domingensis]